jgi:hypothetical protein
MCILYAISLWWRCRGKIIIQLRPHFHVMIGHRGRLIHGTNRRGRWQFETLSPKAFGAWLAS